MSRTVVGGFTAIEITLAMKLVERVDLLQAARLDAEAEGDEGRAVSRAALIHDPLVDAPIGALRAAVVLLSTPELRTVPVVLAGGERQAKRDGRGSVIAATFAQAITVHKSQGSQWDNVLVIDESSVFYGAAFREHEKLLGRDGAAIEAHINGQRWLYTGTTRAAKRIVIAPRLNGLVRG